MRCNFTCRLLLVIAITFSLTPTFAKPETDASVLPNDVTLWDMDDILAEEVTHPERVKNGDLTEVDIDTILSESSTTKDDIAKSFSTMMQTSNVTGNTTGNATAAAKKELAESQIIAQIISGLDTSTYTGTLKDIYELGYCIALEIYDATTKTCEEGSSVTSSVIAAKIRQLLKQQDKAAGTDVVPEIEFMEAAPKRDPGSVQMKVSTTNPDAAGKAEAMTPAKIIAGASTALAATGATLSAGSSLATADQLTVSKPKVTANSSEDSAAPSPHQVASLALVFGIVAATNSMFA